MILWFSSKQMVQNNPQGTLFSELQRMTLREKNSYPYSRYEETIHDDTKEKEGEIGKL